jgi:hypothetical protein
MTPDDELLARMLLPPEPPDLERNREEEDRLKGGGYWSFKEVHTMPEWQRLRARERRMRHFQVFKMIW